MSGEIAYPSLRAYLEANPDGMWIMLGGDDKGKVRTSAGLLAENQSLILMRQGGGGVAFDTLELPVVERDRTVYFPKGTWVLGFRLPVDMPLMSEEFRP